MCSWMRRSWGSLAEMVSSEYFFTNPALGPNMRAATNSQPVRVIRRVRIPPVRDLCSEYGVMMTYASCWGINYLATGGLSGAGVAGAGMAGAGAAVGAVALPPRILNITVPQVGHLPLMALRPFFIVSSAASTISFLALHLPQYPSGIKILPLRRFMPRGSYWG